MKLRFVRILFLCLPFALFSAEAAAAGGCGWDYPCPPEPSFGRPETQVTVHNNYGSVNVYTARRPPVIVDPGFDPGPCVDDGCRYGCGGYPCTEQCGTLCWIRRLRQGYCGHGCQSYIDRARIEAEERAAWKEEEAWKKYKEEWMYRRRPECAPPDCAPGYDDRLPPSPATGAYYYDKPRYRDYAASPRPPRPEPSKPDLTPRERYRGPPYPATGAAGRP